MEQFSTFQNTVRLYVDYISLMLMLLKKCSIFEFITKAQVDTPWFQNRFIISVFPSVDNFFAIYNQYYMIPEC